MKIDEEFSLTPQDLADLPSKTGVYIFRGRRNPNAEISTLYVGKAKNLKSRVRQYFIEGLDTRPFVKFIRERVETIHYVIVENDQDALLLENELIKKNKPAYNIALKDDKRYLTLRIDRSHEWPKIDVVRKIKRDSAVYFGPFSSSGRLRMTVDFMQKAFPLRTCSDHKLYNRSRPCLEYDLKRCVAPCVNYVTREEYSKIVNDSIAFLHGEHSEIILKLKSEMETLAREDKFEEAAKIRDRVQAIEVTTERQNIIGVKQFQRGTDQDVVGLARDETRALINLIFIRNGVILDKKEFEIRKPELDDESLLIEFLNRYYSSEVYMPHEILVPFEINPELLEFTSNVIVPRSEEKLSFLSVAKENAEAKLSSLSQKIRKMGKTLESLKRLLALQQVPAVIDCFDISHHQGKETVASVVRFVEGVPFKDGYRRIKLTIDQVDDFHSMKEAVCRRYHSIEDLPHLIVIDGGRGQLSSAHQALLELGFAESLEIVSLAKARDSDEIDPLNPMNRERIFRIGQKNPILLKEDSSEELLLRYIRDEAHRFAIKYHRERKVKSLSISVLDQVPGMTERIKLKLLRRFGDIDGIIAALDLELLEAVPKKMLEPLRLTLKGALPE